MVDVALTYFDSTISRDFFRLFCGVKIGEGMSRAVHACSVRPDLVVKIETAAGTFQNAVEWETWTQLKDTPSARWLAPCEHISDCGTVLLQRRTDPMKAGQEPGKMPVFLSDFKRDNYGVLDGRIVCHDYGTSLVISHGASTRLKKVDWW